MNELEVGDTVEVCNPLRKKEYSFFTVMKIVGNKAHTKFRVFHKRIYNNKYVYEYGKSMSMIYNNDYIVHKEKGDEK